jgi:hypothetical protein
MDLMQTASLNGFDTRVSGTTGDYSKTAGSAVAVITSGIPRKPGMTREELISLTIDKYTDLQRIKKSNGGVENKELDYQIKVTLAKLSSLGISVEDITL